MTYRIKIATESLEINIKRSFKPDFLVRLSFLKFLLSKFLEIQDLPGLGPQRDLGLGHAGT